MKNDPHNQVQRFLRVNSVQNKLVHQNVTKFHIIQSVLEYLQEYLFRSCFELAFSDRSIKKSGGGRRRKKKGSPLT
jgi:hypothetical protein